MSLLGIENPEIHRRGKLPNEVADISISGALLVANTNVYPLKTS